MMTKRQLQQDNAALRQKLEEIYDMIAEALGFDDDNEETNRETDEESDAPDFDDEK
ncbi:MAG: hypothetical protein ND866_30065 [Pyrinomonadaceae bacterium]|nr:hypothetical protein [Pyrinomonadaceae bacterium]